MTLPDTFIIGAPRCGTTSLHTYLAQHPQLHLPEPKEPHHLCDDLWFGHYDYYKPWRSREAYLAMFDGAPEGTLRWGEGSTWYLYSQTALANLRAMQPQARILVALRHPLDYLQSMHAHLLAGGTETVASFEDAIRLSAEERRARGIPLSLHFEHGFDYLKSARFSEQIARLLATFSREQVHFVMLDEMERDPRGTYAQVLRFLDVDPSFEPTFEKANSNRVVTRPLLHRLLNSQASWKRALVAPIPRPVREKLWKRINKLSTRHQKRDRASQAERRRLAQPFDAEVKTLSEVLGEDLSRWRAEAM
jgi:hypothetical protein